MFVSIVVPLFNETESLPVLLETLASVLATTNCDYEIVCVDDGSNDKTPQLLADAATHDNRIKVIQFSRNFGHQAAVTAGLDFATGDAVIVMDADLQDPPELIPEMIAQYRNGYHIVSPQRIKREGDSLSKRFLAAAFYKLMRRMVDRRLLPEVGDFRLFSREAILAIRSFREQHRFMRGIVAWLGLREAILPFERHPRYAGATKYPLWKSLRFAWTAMVSFSALPLRLTVTWGLLVACAGTLYAAFSAYQALILHITVPGWTSLVCIVTFFSGNILIAIGLVGEYVAHIFEESKARPLYVVSGLMNVEETRAPQRAIIVHTPSPKEMKVVSMK